MGSVPTVAYDLEEDGRSVQSISALLAFASPALLTNHIRRYTGMNPTLLPRDPTCAWYERAIRRRTGSTAGHAGHSRAERLCADAATRCS